tara:strand:- start:205 stop:408 length:204 start_codon:yes stop_codon:yes gene_type:complete
MTVYPNYFCIVVHLPGFSKTFYTSYWKEADTKKQLEEYLDELSDMGYVIGDVLTQEEARLKYEQRNK